MGRNAQTVPYGYEPPPGKQRGTLIYYDTFEHTADAELGRAAELTQSRSFGKLVLYPLHEETFKRMSKEPVSAYYKREDRLHEWKRDGGLPDVAVEGWEGKRKKYTPIDTALRYLTEKYDAPHMLYMTPEFANAFASFSSFEEWIVKLRILLTSKPEAMHPRLQKYLHRCDFTDADADAEQE